MSSLRAAIEHPWTAARLVKSKLLRPLIDPPENRINILEEDWDNLITLDACRFDSFEEHNTLTGSLERIYSTASHTAEFVDQNITRSFSDTVYISASPQLAGTEDRFYHLEHLWEDHWDDELNTVPPWAVTEQAREISESNPDKRLIVHYMQPHYPFIGEKGREIGKHATFTVNV